MPRHRRGWAMGNGPGCGSRHTPLIGALLEPALLALLKNQPRHGYTLLSDLESLGLVALHPSVVYRTLRDMEALGWINSDWQTDQTQGPPRRTYHITVQGEEALKNWKQELNRTYEIILNLIDKIE